MAQLFHRRDILFTGHLVHLVNRMKNDRDIDLARSCDERSQICISVMALSPCLPLSLFRYPLSIVAVRFRLRKRSGVQANARGNNT